MRIINEPTAAALAYGLDQKAGNDDSTNVLIFDLGGGTFDATVLNLEGGVFQVLATGGDTRLGGEDFDNTLVDFLVTEFKAKHKLELTEARELSKLKAAAERAKREMSASQTAKVELSVSGEEYSVDVARAKFESLNAKIFARTLETVKKVLKDAKMDPADIDDVVLVGGSTRIPKVQELLSEFFGGRQLCRSINPDEAVAYGAAVQGAILSGVRHATTDSLVLVDVTPLSLGIELEDKSFSVLIPRNTNIPCKKSDSYTTTENYQESIEIVVYEGERPHVSGNRKLGEFSIRNIERAKRGEPQIEVTFELDANGILNVGARDKKTGARAECRIEGACKGIDPAEIARMVREAETFANEDIEYRKQLELKTELEGLAYDVQDRYEGKEGAEGAGAAKARECLEWLEDLKTLGKPGVGRALERWLQEIRQLESR